MRDPTGNWSELMVHANDDLRFFDESFDGVDAESDNMEYARDVVHEEMVVRYPTTFNTTEAGNDVAEL